MAFQLKPDEPVPVGVSRVAERELAKALAQLRSHGRDDDAVHEVRKSLKRLRALLRLVREGLGEAAYHRENLAFRDIARPLTRVRDAAVLVETLTALVGGSARPIAAGAHAALLRNQRTVARRILVEGRAFATAATSIEKARKRLLDWAVEKNGWRAVADGLRRTYRGGRRALAAAAAEPTVEKLHEWRKRTKYLWHQLQLIEPAWSANERDLGERAHELTEHLGHDHDLAVLRRTLVATPLAFGGRGAVKALVTLIDRERREAQAKASGLGRAIYREPPRLFVRRMEGYWKTWRSGRANSPRGATSRRNQSRGREGGRDPSAAAAEPARPAHVG